MSASITEQTYEPIFKEIPYNGTLYKFLEMAFCKGLLSFLLGIKAHDVESANYLYQKGWPHFKDYASEVKRYYETNKGGTITFSEILDLEKLTHTKSWQNISAAEERIMYKIANELEQHIR